MVETRTRKTPERTIATVPRIVCGVSISPYPSIVWWSPTAGNNTRREKAMQATYCFEGNAFFFHLFSAQPFSFFSRGKNSGETRPDYFLNQNEIWGNLCPYLRELLFFALRRFFLFGCVVFALVHCVSPRQYAGLEYLLSCL